MPRRPFGSRLHKKECSEAANFDFETVRRLTLATERARRLFKRTRERLHMRRLTTDSRRRRTYRYTPWALVTVDDPKAKAEESVACAYEYGVPQASGEFYRGSGAYGSEVWDAEGVAMGWGNESTRACWVRTQGESGQEGEYCSVSMLVPGTLKKRAEELKDCRDLLEL